MVQAAKPASQQKVDLAERELPAAIPQGAEKLAQEALAAEGRSGAGLFRAGPGGHHER